MIYIILNKDEIREKSIHLLRQYIGEHAESSIGGKYYCINHEHKDNDASMSYYETDCDGKYDPHMKCFGLGCGKRYDLFGAIQEIENVSFEEAVAVAANMAGVEIVRDDDTILEAFTRAEHYITSFKKLHPYVEKYLSGKDIDPEEMRKFGVGVINNYKHYHKYMTQEYEAQKLVEFGLIHDVDPEKQGKFRAASLIFTVHNPEGAPVALTVRPCEINPEHKLPKYINSSNHRYYSKSKCPYMLDKITSNVVYVVEGYTDALYLNMKGINAVALIGTNSNTLPFEIMMGKGIDSMIFVLDGDQAGQMGVISILEKVMTKIKAYSAVVKLPDGTDPDDYVREHGADAFKSLRPISSSGFWLRYSDGNYDSEKLSRAIDLMTKLTISNAYGQCVDIANFARESGYDTTADEIFNMYKEKRINNILPSMVDRLNNIYLETQKLSEEIIRLREEMTSK
jgi:DNA primase catalytic core